MEMKIPIPDGVQETLKLTEKEFSAEAKALLAAKLYELGRLSAGLAAELAGMERLKFLSELGRYGTPAINLRDEEVTKEIETGRQMNKIRGWSKPKSN